MKKNGFTLVELLAVIALIAILGVVASGIMVGSLGGAKDDINKIQEKMIISAAKAYVVDNGCSGTCTVSVSTLISEGYIDDTTDVRGSITVTESSGKYTYTPNLVINPIEYSFDYTGAVQEITLQPGTYKLEVWGAQGGDNTNASAAGKGGYSTGIYTVSATTTLYIYVGGKGNIYTTSGGGAIGGWNGGGAAYASAWGRGSGGGATDISLVGGDCTLTSNRYIRTTASYNDRIIVAGGGGGATGLTDGMTTESAGSAGYGGGSLGGAGTSVSGTGQGRGAGGSSTSAGTNTSYSAGNGSFGYGGSGTSSFTAAGGGGGYYGGAAGSGAGGGSGYVSSSLDERQTIAGNQPFTDPDGTTVTGHSGNGYARITKQ